MGEGGQERDERRGEEDIPGRIHKGQNLWDTLSK
jgi:hypothetical protein